MRRMPEIAVDARPLSAPPGGIRRYTSNLLREIAVQYPTSRFFLYSDRPFNLDFPLPATWRIRAGSGNLRSSTAFAQAVFPLWAIKDRVQSFWSPRHQLPLLLPSRIRKILTIHDLVWKRFPETMKRGGPTVEAFLTPNSIRIADQIIADSVFTRDELLHFFPEVRHKTQVVYLASNLQRDGLVAARVVADPYFLFVGSSEPRKNLKRLLEAYLGYVRSVRTSLDLVMAGADQWGDFNVPAFLRSKAIESKVHVLRSVSDEMLRSLYANAYACIMVSLYEGFGLPLVEAMQWGVPLIASRDSAMAEIAGDAALLVNPRETEEISAALRQLSEDQVLHSQLACASEQRRLRFDWTIAAAETAALIFGGSSGI
jgi:glycosyltransferase involved in cell wall biosynthesis